MSVEWINAYANLEKLNWLKEELIRVQCRLQEINSAISGYKNEKNQIYFENENKHLEDCIDEMTEKIPKLTNFILPVSLYMLSNGILLLL